MSDTPKTMACWRHGKWHADELANLAANQERELSDLERENAKLREQLDWQNMPNRNPSTHGGYEFYVNEEWMCVARMAIDEDSSGQATLMKKRYDPDDERVRVRRVLDDDALLADLAAANERAEKLAKWREGHLRILDVSNGHFHDALSKVRHLWLQHDTPGVDGICEKLRSVSAQSEALRKALEVCHDALTYGGDRLVVLINSERSKCKGDHWDFWDYLAEKLRLALTAAKSALGQQVGR